MRGARPGARRRPRTAAGHERPVEGTPADLTPEADPEQVARTICLQQLTLAPRTRAQLEEVLARRDVPDVVAQRVLDRFTEVGLVDDAAYAEAWVRSRHAGRGLARRALAHELRQRGVDDEVAAEAVDTLDPEQERDTARRLVERKAAAMRGLDRAVATRRLVGMLARKGYSSGTAFTVVRDVLNEQAVDEEAAEQPEGDPWEPGEL